MSYLEFSLSHYFLDLFQAHQDVIGLFLDPENVSNEILDIMQKGYKSELSSPESTSTLNKDNIQFMQSIRASARVSTFNSPSADDASDKNEVDIFGLPSSDESEVEGSIAEDDNA